MAAKVRVKDVVQDVVYNVLGGLPVFKVERRSRNGRMASVVYYMNKYRAWERLYEFSNDYDEAVDNTRSYVLTKVARCIARRSIWLR